MIFTVNKFNTCEAVGKLEIKIHYVNPTRLCGRGGNAVAYTHFKRFYNIFMTDINSNNSKSLSFNRNISESELFSEILSWRRGLLQSRISRLNALVRQRLPQRISLEETSSASADFRLSNDWFCIKWPLKKIDQTPMSVDPLSDHWLLHKGNFSAFYLGHLTPVKMK